MKQEEIETPQWIIDYDKQNYHSSAGRAIRELIGIIDKLASTPKVDLVEVERLVQHSAYTDAYNAVCGEIGMMIQDNTFNDRIDVVRDEIVEHQRWLIGYTLSDLTSEKEEGR